MANISQIKIPGDDTLYDIHAASLLGLTASVTELNQLQGVDVTKNVQTQLNEKVNTIELTELLQGKVNTSQTINTHSLEGDIILTPADLGAVDTDTFDATVETLQLYTDERINEIIGPGSTAALDTINELATALRGNKDIISVLERSISEKANIDSVYAKEEADLLFASADQGVLAENAVRSVSGNEENGFVTVDTGGTISTVEVYSHPIYPSVTTGLYKIIVDTTGHVSEVIPVAKSDITDLGIPGQDTTYSGGTGIEINGTIINNIGVSSISTDGQGSITATTKGVSDTMLIYEHPAHTAYDSGFYKITTNALGHVTAVTPVTKDDIVALGISDTDTTYSAGDGLELDSTTFSIAGQGVQTAHIADGNITLAKLSSDIGTVAVSSEEPTQESVKLWIKI